MVIEMGFFQCLPAEEPVIRIIAEARTAVRARAALRRLKAEIAALKGEL